MVLDVVIDQVGGAVDTRPIRALLDVIVRQYQPLEIRLFGSRARGTATPESDWDLFVVVPNYGPDHEDPLLSYRLTRAARARADVVFCDRADFEEDAGTPNTLAYEVAHFGVMLYER